jgi:putative membrane protein
MKTMKHYNLATSFLALLFAFGLGGIPSNAFGDDKSMLNATDTKFVKEAAESGMGEVKIATLGSQKAERADVKDLATMLVADHTKLNSDLTAFAQAKKIDLSAVISAKAADHFKDLEQKSGGDFDKAFLDHMEKSHKKSIDNFEGIEKDAADSELKAWVSKTLPTLRAHLEKVKALQSK